MTTQLLPVASASGLTVNTTILAALTDWASEDTTRIHINSIGYRTIKGQPHLCATDGHTLAVIPFDDSSRDIGAMDGSWWPIALVETACKVAKAQKAETVVLSWETCSKVTAEFPPVEQLIPQRAKSAAGWTAVQPKYLARMAKLGEAFVKALGGSKATCSIGIAQWAKGSELDPWCTDVMQDIGRDKPSRSLATMFVMPVRISTAGMTPGVASGAVAWGSEESEEEAA